MKMHVPGLDDYLDHDPNMDDPEAICELDRQGQPLPHDWIDRGEDLVCRYCRMVIDGE
jgi:hypothetical protein